jgi:serine/threonine-protein kinase RsbW
VVEVLPEPKIDEDLVVLTVPADGAYFSVLRTATAGLAARLHFTLDEIEDLRIAVDEACAMLLTEAVPGTDLTAEFELTGQEMQVRVEVATVGSSAPKRDDFAWMVLTALADDVDAVTDSPDRMAIVLRKRRGVARSA